MTRLKIMALGILLMQTALFAQEEDVQKLVEAMKDNNVEILTSMFDQSIEVVTPYADGVYSQKQAAQVLKSFFSKHPCSSFELGHTGNSSGGSKFVIATYVSGSNTYRLSVFLKKAGEGYLIQGLSFED